MINAHNKDEKSARLAQIIRLYESGQVSELMDQRLSKLLSTEAAEARNTVEVLESDLTEFEDKYGLKSSQFFERFEHGDMGDAMDYIEWASLYQMYVRANKRLELLTEVE
ncbi:MAG: hypothetical protein R3C44_11575 [Chloroflexota bacterium]